MPRGRKKSLKNKFKFSIKPGTLKALTALFLLLLFIVTLVSFFSPNRSLNKVIQEILRGNFGYASILIPFVFGLGSLFCFENFGQKLKEPRIITGLILVVLSLAGLFDILTLDGGGNFGRFLVQSLEDNVGRVGSVGAMLIFNILSFTILLDVSIDEIYKFLSSVFGGVKIGLPKVKLPVLNAKSKKEIETDEDIDISSNFDASSGFDYDENALSIGTKAEDLEDEVEFIPAPSEPVEEKIPTSEQKIITSISAPIKPDFSFSDKIWKYPPLDLLADPPAEIVDTTDAEQRSKIIKDTLKSFGVDVDVVDIKVGSSVTQYSLQPKSVTKISKIASLQENLAMALASPTGSVRIEAPIPGKSLIGVEVPNMNRTMVYFKSLLSSELMKNAKSKLTITLGRDVAGRSYAYDIAKMPHLLIAGSTGSGKSIFIHNILFSILFRASPQEVKFILIDPKRVEMIYYRDIPHLLTPVVTDMETAPSVFKWAVAEMERRLKLFEQAQARNIESFNEKAGFQAMPYIVIIVDELAEIMIMDPAGVEKSIIRLAQLARATGIHLILAVQRPSTNIITGIIKANIPCRIAFNVTSQVDSRVIIDQPGAEKLLGKGDMLFVPPDAQKPTRLQNAFIFDKEIAGLVTFLKSQGIGPDYRQEVLQMNGDKSRTGQNSSWGDDVGDDLFDQAVELIMSSGKASASLLQRKLSIGYARAARLIDLMEEKGIISGAMGASKTREILMSGAPKGNSNETDLNPQNIDYISEFERGNQM